MTSLPATIMESLHELDAEVRFQMLRGVVVVGGSASLPGLAERLKAELGMMVPEHVRATVDVRVWNAGEHR